MRLVTLLLSAALSLGCAGIFGTKEKGGGDDTGIERPPDADRDGYPEGEDCDDARADVNPGEDEVCDASDTDEDCDGLADSADPGLAGGLTVYHDADGDGFGDPSAASLACEVTAGYLTDATDCDDADAAVHPGAVEVCDAADTDEDCSGAADNDDVNATGTSTFYTDADEDGLGDPDSPVAACDEAGQLVDDSSDCDDGDAAVGADTPWFMDDDGDGYGDADDGSIACDQPAGSVADDTDCDDGDAAVHPAAPERCNGWDDDCDGMEDDDDDDVDPATFGTFYADDDGDGYGDAASTGAGCVAPAGYTTDDQDCDDDDAAVNPGEAEVCRNGVDDDCDGSVGACALTDTTLSASTTDVFLYGEDVDDLAGAAVEFVGDVDGDGYDDVGIGAVGDDDGGAAAGALYIVGGGITGSLDLGSADAKLYGTDADAALGYGVTGAGDVDGDGYDDVVVGAYLYGSENGAVWLAYGPLSGDGPIDSVSGVALVSGAAASDRCGLRNGGGRDVSGDGQDDVIFGCPGDDASASAAGAAYVVTTAPSGTSTTSSSAWYQLRGEAADDGAGYTNALVQDVDGDGNDDVMVGAAAGNTAYVVHGPITGDMSLGGADTVLTKADGSFGFVVSSAGDGNADGYGDVAVTRTADTSGSDHVSNVYLYAGASGGVSSASEVELAGVPSWEEGGEGRALDALGDIDGDGYDDLLVSGPRVDASVLDEGAAYLVLGPVTSDTDLEDFARFCGADAYDYAGTWSGGGGDFDGDGWPDFIVGAGGEDTGGSAAGAAYVVFGGGL